MIDVNELLELDFPFEVRNRPRPRSHLGAGRGENPATKGADPATKGTNVQSALGAYADRLEFPRFNVDERTVAWYVGNGYLKELTP